MIDYSMLAGTLRKVVALPKECPAVSPGRIYREQLILLQKGEWGMAMALERGGMSKEAAASAAVSFFAQCIERNGR